jgi:hypothetical protein
MSITVHICKRGKGCFNLSFTLLECTQKIMLCLKYVNIPLASVPAQLLTLKSIQQQQTGHMLIDFNMLYLLMLCLCKVLSIFIS